MYPSDKKDDDFNFKRVLQCFLPLAMYPFGFKGCKKINFLINAPFGRFSLAMYPSDHFFLKALFLRALRRTFGASRLEGTLIRIYFLVFTLVAMDFSRAGYVHSLTDAFRARAQWKDSGRPREC